MSLSITFKARQKISTTKTGTEHSHTGILFHNMEFYTDKDNSPDAVIMFKQERRNQIFDVSNLKYKLSLKKKSL